MESSTPMCSVLKTGSHRTRSPFSPCYTRWPRPRQLCRNDGGSTSWSYLYNRYTNPNPNPPHHSLPRVMTIYIFRFGIIIRVQTWRLATSLKRLRIVVLKLHTLSNSGNVSVLISVLIIGMYSRLETSFCSLEVFFLHVIIGCMRWLMENLKTWSTSSQPSPLRLLHLTRRHIKQVLWVSIVCVLIWSAHKSSLDSYV